MGGRDPQKAGLNYDEVMDYIGQFGRFQRRIFLWLSLVSGAAGLAVVERRAPWLVVRWPVDLTDPANFTDGKPALRLKRPTACVMSGLAVVLI